MTWLGLRLAFRCSIHVNVFSFRLDVPIETFRYSMLLLKLPCTVSFEILGVVYSGALLLQEISIRIGAKTC